MRRRSQLLFLHNAVYMQLSAAGHNDSLDFHHSALVSSVYAQSMYRPDAVFLGRKLLRTGRIMAGLDHKFHVCRLDFLTILHLRKTCGHLHHVDSVPPTGRIASAELRHGLGHMIPRAICRSGCDQADFADIQGPEKHLHAPAAQRRWQFLRTARGGSHQAKIRGHPVLEHLVNIPRNGGILGIIIGGIKGNTTVFQHFEQLIHLNGMQFADFIQKQHAAVGFGHRARLRLRNSLNAQTARTLINGIMNAAEKRIGNGAFVKPHAGGVYFNKRSILTEGRARAFLCRLQYQTGGAGLSNAGRSIDDHMLGVAAAQDRRQCFDPLPLADDIIKALGPHMLAQRF